MDCPSQTLTGWGAEGGQPGTHVRRPLGRRPRTLTWEVSRGVGVLHLVDIGLELVDFQLQGKHGEEDGENKACVSTYGTSEGGPAWASAPGIFPTAWGQGSLWSPLSQTTNQARKVQQTAPAPAGGARTPACRAVHLPSPQGLLQAPAPTGTPSPSGVRGHPPTRGTLAPRKAEQGQAGARRAGRGGGRPVRASLWERGVGSPGAGAGALRKPGPRVGHLPCAAQRFTCGSWSSACPPLGLGRRPHLAEHLSPSPSLPLQRPQAGGGGDRGLSERSLPRTCP